MTGTKKNETATAPKLTQDVVNAILTADPKRGRTEVAAQLGIPPAQVWAVRTAAGLTKVDATAKTYCLGRLERAGVVIPVAKATPKKRAARKTVAKKAA